MTEREALKLALEALEHEAEIGNDDAYRKERDAIRKALAQPEQEPHSWYSKQENEWMTHKTRMEHEQLNSYTHKVGKFDLALYTTPPQRKPLTDEVISALWSWSQSSQAEATANTQQHAFARAIEAVIGIKE